MIEAIIVATLIALLVIPLWDTLKGGAKGSLFGMRKIDTFLEAERILRLLHQDLKCSLFIIPSGKFNGQNSFLLGNPGGVSAGPKPNIVVTKQGTWPNLRFSFVYFPFQGEIDRIVGADRSEGLGNRLLNRIEYRLEASKEYPSCFSLVRKEVFHPDHPLAGVNPGGAVEKVLSNRVNYFEIECFSPPEAPDVQVFWVRISLYETPPAGIGTNPPGSILADSGKIVEFFDTVSSDFFQNIRQTVGYRPCYHIYGTSAPTE